ncbi:hypothetical protein PG984_013910 [Apiospora sp. TS-2023a]
MGNWQTGVLPDSPVNGEAPEQIKSSDPEFQDPTGTKTKIRNLISQFLEGIGYSTPAQGDDFDGMLQGMHDQVRELGIPYPEGSKAWYCLKFGAYYANVCFPRHPLDLRIYLGIYTWLALLIDDAAVREPAEWSQFVGRFYSGQPQPSPMARAWDVYLRRASVWYEPLVANFIVLSALNFVNSTALAGAKFGSSAWSPTAGAVRWPYFLRDKEGMSESYVWFTFPRALYPEIALCVEAIPDMGMYLNFANDITSFYKEEMEGEKDNYMHNKAFADGKDVYQVLEDAVKETIAAHRRILLVLGGTGKEEYCQAWLEHEMGYAAWHMSMGRYRLREIGLGENYTDQNGWRVSTRK